jgi:hypothetical protein
VSGPSESSRRDSIEISVSRPFFRDLQPQASADSLRSATSAHSDFSETKERDSHLFRDEDTEELQLPVSPPAAPQTREQARRKSYQSLFGGPSPDDDDDKADPFRTRGASQNTDFKLSRRHSLQTLPSPAVSPTRTSLQLPSISEVSSEIEQPTHSTIKQLQRSSSTVSENSYFPDPAAPLAPPKRASTFITAADLLARLQTSAPARAKSTISATRPPEYDADGGKMQVLKRGERSGQQRHSSLRRVGSALDSPRNSSEHVIFGERYATPVDLTRDDVLEAWGARAPEPTSPTRPPSIRRRQSLKLTDLEQKVETLGAENSGLVQQNANLSKTLSEVQATHKEAEAALNTKLDDAQKVLADKISEIEELGKKLMWYQEEVERLTSTNESLVENNKGLVKNNKGLSTAYKMSQANFTMRLEKKTAALAELSQEHADLQARYAALENNRSASLEKEIEQKDAELALLHAELQKAREEVRGLERKVMARQSNRYLDIKDPVHFAVSAEALFQEVQRWCEEFSRFSAGRRCTHVHRVTDEAIKERFENVMLDDRGVRRMLKDESRRATALSAILMRLIWEFVFTRYLFGLETEERQKLLSLERTLAEVGM